MAAVKQREAVRIYADEKPPSYFGAGIYVRQQRLPAVQVLHTFLSAVVATILLGCGSGTCYIIEVIS